jgi:hypothetical protein
MDGDAFIISLALFTTWTVLLFALSPTILIAALQFSNFPYNLVNVDLVNVVITMVACFSEKLFPNFDPQSIQI